MLDETKGQEQEQKKTWRKPELHKASVNGETENDSSAGTTDSTVYKNGS